MYLKTIIKNSSLHLAIGIMMGFWLGTYLGLIWYVLTLDIEESINLLLGLMFLLGLSFLTLGTIIDFMYYSIKRKFRDLI